MHTKFGPRKRLKKVTALKESNTYAQLNHRWEKNDSTCQRLLTADYIIINDDTE